MDAKSIIAAVLLLASTPVLADGFYMDVGIGVSLHESIGGAGSACYSLPDNPVNTCLTILEGAAPARPGIVRMGYRYHNFMLELSHISDIDNDYDNGENYAFIMYRVFGD